MCDSGEKPKYLCWAPNSFRVDMDGFWVTISKDEKEAGGIVYPRWRAVKKVNGKFKQVPVGPVHISQICARRRRVAEVPCGCQK